MSRTKLDGMDKRDDEEKVVAVHWHVLTSFTAPPIFPTSSSRPDILEAFGVRIATSELLRVR